MRPRVLLLLSPETYRAADFLTAAERAGVDLVVGTEVPQALAGEAVAHNLAVSLADPERAAAAAEAYAARSPLTAVLAPDEAGIAAAASCARRLGLPHNRPEALAACRDKGSMRRALAAAGCPTPQFELLDRAAEWGRAETGVGYPCVVKPTFLSASRGVMRADDRRGLREALARLERLLARPEVADRAPVGVRPIIVEEFIPGREFALEGLIDQGRFRLLALFDKPDPLDGPCFEETIYVTPSRQPAALQAELARSAERAALALGLSEGAVHAEVRADEGRVALVELAPRSIGGLCSRALRFGTGMSLEELLLRQACRLPLPALEREPLASGVMMIPIPAGGTLAGVEGVQAARNVSGVEDVVIAIPVGQEVVPLPEGNRYLGFIFARAGRPEQVEEALRAAHSSLTFRIVPPAPGARPR